MTGAWQGSIRLRTQGAQAPHLLEELTTVVERAQGQLGIRPTAVERSPLAREAPEKLELSFRSEKPAQPAWYVSYAWGDDKTPEGAAGEGERTPLSAANLAAPNSRASARLLLPGLAVR